MGNIVQLTPVHGVAIGNNPNQPKTNLELEWVVTALRLVNVGEFGNAKQVIENAGFNSHQKEWLTAELMQVVSYLR